MSALGQKQTSAHVRVMSALPPKADIGTQSRNVRFVPKADILRGGRDWRYSITSSATARSCGGNVNRLTDSVAAVFALVGVQLLVVSFCYFQYRKILAAVPS